MLGHLKRAPTLLRRPQAPARRSRAASLSTFPDRASHPFAKVQPRSRRNDGESRYRKVFDGQDQIEAPRLTEQIDLIHRRLHSMFLYPLYYFYLYTHCMTV